MSDLANPVTFGLLFAAGLAALLLALMVWRSRSEAFPTGALTLVRVFAAEVLIAYSFSYSTALTFDQQVLAIRATYVGWLVAPIAFLVFIARATGHDRWLNRWMAALFVALPVSFAVVIFGPWSTDLFFGGGFDPETFAFSRTSPIYIAFYLWTYALLTIAVGLTAVSAITSPRLHRTQIALVLAMTLLPWVLSSLSFLNFRFFGVGPAVLSLIPVCIPAYAISRFKAFDLRPMTEAESFLGSETGVVVLDDAGRVSAMNPSAVRLLGPGRSPAMGRELEEVWSHRPEVVAALRGAPVGDIPVRSSDGRGTLAFATSSMSSPADRISGSVVVIRVDGDDAEGDGLESDGLEGDHA